MFNNLVNLIFICTTLVSSAPLRGVKTKTHPDREDLSKDYSKDFSHHQIKSFRTWEGEFVEVSATRIETSTHCANPWSGGENRKELKSRYDLRTDTTVPSSDSALEGTFRARCIPVPLDDDPIAENDAKNTPLTDQCIKEGTCEGDECTLILADCPKAAKSTPEAPRWAHSGSLAAKPDLIKIYTSQDPDAHRRCLFAKSVEDANKPGKHHQIPVTRPCPPKEDGDPSDDFQWWIKPRIGLVGNAKYSKCISLLPESSGSKKNGPLRLRSCLFMDTPIYQSFDMYKSTHTEHDTCEDVLPAETTVLDLTDLPQFLLKLSGMDKRVKALKTNGDNGKSSVKTLLKKWTSKLSAVLPGGTSGAAKETVDKLEAETEATVSEAAHGTAHGHILPKLDVSMGGSVVYGRAYGLPLNNDYYKLRASNNYRCSRLPLQAHANKRYGMLAVDVPLSASVGIDVAGDGNSNVGVGVAAAASMCMVWNMCARSFAIELSSSLLISMAAGPSIGGQIQGGFGTGISLTGELERSMDIPLWDGSRPEWVDSEFNLRDNGHFWFDYNAKLETPTEFMDPDSDSSLLSIELDGDILINVNPRSYDDMTTDYRHLGDGVLLWNGHEGTQTNLLITLDIAHMQREFNHMNNLHARKNEAPPNKCTNKDGCLKQCQDICDRFNEECHFISFYFSADHTQCHLYRTGNTVKAKRRSAEELKQLGYEEPALLTSYFRDPKLVVSKLKPQKVPPSFTDEENEESEKNPQSAITRLMGGGTAVGSEHADASKKSMLDALFTVSAIGKLTLALNLKKYTYGMVNLELTLAAAVAIRAGKNLPNAGVYITLDLSGSNEGDEAMQKAAVGQLLQGPAKVYNDVADTANQAKDHVVDNEHAQDINIEKMNAEGIAQLTTSGKASATAQFFFRDLKNFGFRTKTLMRTGSSHDPNSVVKSTFLEMKAVDGKFMVCYSKGSAPRPKCASSVLEIMGLAGEVLVNIVKDFAGAVMLGVGKLVDGVLQVGKAVGEAVGKGIEAAAAAAAAVVEAIEQKAEELKAAAAAAVEATKQAALKAAKEAQVVVRAVAQFCTFGIFDTSKNFGTCCGGPDRGQTMPGVLFDHAIKYSWDLALENSNKYDWTRWIQKYSARDYSTICLAQGEEITRKDGTIGPCDRGSCPCKEGQVCEIRSLGSDYNCWDVPGSFDKQSGGLTFDIPSETISDSQGYSALSFDGGDQCQGAMPLALYTRLKEDYSKAYYNPSDNANAAVSKYYLKAYESGPYSWITEINYEYKRGDYTGLCSGKKSGTPCSDGLWSKTYCGKNEVCEGRGLGNECRKVPPKLVDPMKSAYSEHYPKGSSGYQ